MEREKNIGLDGGKCLVQICVRSDGRTLLMCLLASCGFWQTSQRCNSCQMASGTFSNVISRSGKILNDGRLRRELRGKNCDGMCCNDLLN